MSLLIHDGYSLPFKVAKRGTFPEINGMFRPALPEAVNDFKLHQTVKGDAKEETAAFTKMIVGHLISWDVKEKYTVMRQLLGMDKARQLYQDQVDTDMVSVPIVTETVGALPFFIYNQLFDIVTGAVVQEQPKNEQ